MIKCSKITGMAFDRRIKVYQPETVFGYDPLFKKFDRSKSESLWNLTEIDSCKRYKKLL